MRSVLRNLLYIPGWRTSRKIIVIESDDWGSIRMPSADVYNKFIAQGFDLAGSDYNRLDSLETNEDLESLYDVLKSHKDSRGHSAIFTGNIVVGNPDFNKIRNSNFTEYHYEPVTDTIKRYSGCDKVEILWKQGNSENLFHPQFHGREHVNVIRWMEALNQGSQEIMIAFDNETTFSGVGDYNYMEVLDYNSPQDMLNMKESLLDGMNIFERIFGYRSQSFIPPCYTWNSEVEETLLLGGVKYIQGLIVQLIPTGSFGNYKKKYHFIGKRNKYGQYYLVRNAFFEPSLTKSSDPVGECLNRIDIAFRWNKPAIISSHRINFVGSLEKKNRNQNLKMLDELLESITKRWADVEFMTSDQLGDLISMDKNE